MQMIEVEELCKTFRVTRRRSGLLGGLRNVVNPEVRIVPAVNDLSLTVERGEIVGLIGPNGAGKSTTIKMMTGILTPTSGRVCVAGLVPMRQRRELAARIGVVFGQRTQLWWDLPLLDSLHLLRFLYRVPEERYNANLKRLRMMLDLDEFMHTPVRQLSLGQRMRGDLAAALLHDPELLYLDEPTIGLDVVAKARIREFLLSINAERGTTILLTTHDMDDVETLCPRMLIIDHGRKLYDGTVANIRARFGGERILIAVLDAAEAAALPLGSDGQPMLQELPVGVRQVKADGPRLWLSFGNSDSSTIPAHELVAWLGARYRLRDVTFEEPEIEDVIRRIYEEGLLLKNL
ncbi:MAG TPA: ATP-binding cassette domain-containing protein [Ktedonobacteraceae bacterium]|nr:ATP-binding cassette domain-containing protein [Ktedonobacteraceae bacterium]